MRRQCPASAEIIRGVILALLRALNDSRRPHRGCGLKVLPVWILAAISTAIVDPFSRPAVELRANAPHLSWEGSALLNDAEFLFDGPTNALRTIAPAHGAGAGMDTPFMEFFAQGLGKRGFRVVRFEYPYMVSQRSTGRKKPPDREPVLLQTWLSVVDKLGRDGLIIGGKSMGGRIASLVADEAEVAGLVCLGYPFHPVGEPEQLRVAHLESIKTPTLIVQGERETRLATSKMSPATSSRHRSGLPGSKTATTVLSHARHRAGRSCRGRDRDVP